jgi:hypothetical protein
VLVELADTAEYDMKQNQDDVSGPGGWWSLRTEQAISRARTLSPPSPAGAALT